MGWADRSSFWAQPRWTKRAAIQSLTTIRSWPVSCRFIRAGLTLPKNSSLSLISSVYRTSIPVCSEKASSVGRRSSSSSSVSMYSGQLEKTTLRSRSERSGASRPSSGT